MINVDEIPDGTPVEFVYLLSKAGKYLKAGPAAYRAADMFKMPPADASEELLAIIQSGMEQICSYRGYSRDNPFTGLGIKGFYALLSTLHFEVEQQSATRVDAATILDTMHMRHRMTGEEIVLYNLVQDCH